MLLIRITIFMLLLGSLTLSACGSSSKESVTGTVTYLQRIALPPDAVVTIRIEDVSKADAPAEVIGEQVIQTEGAQVPIPFQFPTTRIRLKIIIPTACGFGLKTVPVSYCSSTIPAYR